MYALNILRNEIYPNWNFTIQSKYKNYLCALS